MYTTNSKLINSDYNIITKDIVNNLRDHIDIFNKKSKTTFIYSIELEEFENPLDNIMHINFDYFGKSEPNGHCLYNLVKLCGFPLKIWFCHDFIRKNEQDKIYHSSERSKEQKRQYLQRSEVKERYRRNHRKHVKIWRENNKDKVKQFSKVYKQKPEYKEKNKQRLRKLRENEDFRLKQKEYMRKYTSTPEFKENNRYKYYLKTRGLTKEELSIEQWRNIK